MNNKNFLNILLLIIAATLSSIIYFSEDENTLLAQLTYIDPNSISSITINHNNNKTLINKQATDQWLITHPVTIEANNFRISSLLKLINAPTHNQYNLDEIDLNKTGIASSKTKISFDDNTFTFGIINPATNLRYIKFKDQVFTIEDVYFPLLSSHFGTLVSLKLLPSNTDIANNGINKLILLNQTISKDKNGLWQSNIESNADAIATTINHWQHDQAFGIHKYLEREPLADVFVYIEDMPQPITYTVTDTDPWLILARPDIGLEYHFDIDSYKNLIAPE